MEELTKDAYRIFEGNISFEEYLAHTKCMKMDDKLSFLRASFTYKRATECKACNSDVRMVLLCSAIEAVSGGKNVIFKDWLIHNKLSSLANQNEKKIEEILNEAYREFVSSEENREGISYNFRRFLLKYCPAELRKPPIKVYKGKGEEFDIAIGAIYSSFRSLYLHKSIGYASIADKPYIDKETGEEVQLITNILGIKSNGNVLSVELTKITEWFDAVVINSMFQYLISNVC